MDIRNSISLQDRVTPTLRSIMKAMDSTLVVMKNLDRASNNGAQSKAYTRAQKDIKRANNELTRMDNYTKLAGASATKAGGQYSKLGMVGAAAAAAIGAGFRSVGQGIDRTTTSAGEFIRSLHAGVELAKDLANVVNKVMTMSDTSRSQVARLGLYNTSSYSNEELYGQVFATAMATRSSLTDTADLVNKILISGVYSGTSAAQAAIGTAGIINKALIAGGGTSEENARALKQLTQGLASGALQGDELRSIREQTPYFAQVLAEGLAQVDDKFEGIGIGDLKELGAQGELTAERIVKAMWAMQDEINEDFETMPKTFGQAMTSLSNIWQYFLFLLSTADGPLGKINDRLWQFVDYLQSPQGLQLLETVAVGINVVTTALSWALGKAGEFVTYLQENAPVAQSIFIALGAVAVAAGLKAAASWIAACWPILLVAAAAGVVSYAFLDAGYSAEEFVGMVVGGIGWAISVIWDGLLSLAIGITWVIAGIAIGLVWLGMIVASAVMTVIVLVWYILATIFAVLVIIGGAVLMCIQGIIQIIVWAVLAIITVIWFILAVIETVGHLIEAAFRSCIVGVVGLFYGLAQTVLGILNLIARGIDAIFGSELAVTVSKWQGSLEGAFTSFVEEHGPGVSMDQIGETWENFGTGVAGMFTSEDINLYDEMQNLGEGTADLAGGILQSAVDLDNFMGSGIEGMWNWGLGFTGDAIGAGMGATDFFKNGWLDPNAQYNAGYQAGSGLVEGIGNITLGSGNSLFDPQDVNVTGGELDGIKSDVSISDEDVQLLRDMAAREYLLQLQSITPVAHITFGDVRETADVNKIVEVIEQMVEEQMATSLVS